MRQLIIGVIIALAAVVFALQNADPVNVQIFLWDFNNISMALLLLITLILGVLAGILFLGPGIYKRNQTISSQKKRITDLESQISLKNRNIPGN